MKKTVLVFSGLILGIILFIRLSTYTILSGYSTLEFVIALIALVFFFIGVYLNKISQMHLKKPQTKINREKINTLGLSSREYEVLENISEGLSNKEIAEKLFLTESTVKTHVSNVLLKLNAKRRTQAVRIAKRIEIL
ncbi:response regulator transcription factor [Aestuariivivens sediminicola]|uniref:response regulator transcription factor n=1 Tax=Aestuariivivens sediminicola TaxID=2913560 RepID=UPI00293E495F|nr:response regulator transcription factor [Aestuariivivens sediminicola]